MTIAVDLYPEDVPAEDDMSAKRTNRQMAMTVYQPGDFYNLVPKERLANLEFRVAIRNQCQYDAAFREAIMRACRAEPLFWINVFAWGYDPRTKIVDGIPQNSVSPFITRPHQDDAITKIVSYLGIEDIGVEKSRDEGMTWIGVLLCCWEFIFSTKENFSKVGIVSRTEAVADNPGDTDSIGWKIDTELSLQPTWMIGKKGVDWERSQSNHTWTNVRTGSSIAAYAPTSNLTRGGRAKWLLMDELASWQRGKDKAAMKATQHATNSRLFVSTPDGNDGAYYDVMHDENNMKKVVLDWTQNPEKNRGLYRITTKKIRKESGAVVRQTAIEEHDPDNNPLPLNYWEDNREMFERLRRRGYELEGRWRSPWYDHECDRPGSNPQAIAGELDRDYTGSRHLVFRGEFMQVVEDTVCNPLMTGHVDPFDDLTSLHFSRADNGEAKLWIPLDWRGRPPRGHYCFGCDVSTGGGGDFTSNSAIVGVDLVTKKQIFEFATNNIPPKEFAELCVCIAKWFHDAHLAWEANGPGIPFGERVRELEYFNVFHRETYSKATGTKRTNKIGFWKDANSTEVLFEEINNQVKFAELVVQSQKLINEFWEYIYDFNTNKIVHSKAKGTGFAHGDRVIAFGVCAVASKSYRRGRNIPGSNQYSMDDPPPNSMAAREKEYWDSIAEQSDGWDDRTNAQLRA